MRKLLLIAPCLFVFGYIAGKLINSGNDILGTILLVSAILAGLVLVQQ